MFLAVPAGPTWWTGTGCQSVHCWCHRKVWKTLALRHQKVSVHTFCLFWHLNHLCCSSEMIQTEDLCIERGKVTRAHIFRQSSSIITDCCAQRLISFDNHWLWLRLQLCWVLYCDLMCLDYDGNLLDACVIALLAALKNSMCCKINCWKEITRLFERFRNVKLLFFLSILHHDLVDFFE